MSGAEERQDPAEQYRVDKSVETEEQEPPAEPTADHSDGGDGLIAVADESVDVKDN